MAKIAGDSLSAISAQTNWKGVRGNNASRSFDGQVGMAARPAAVVLIGHLRCHRGMAGSAVSRPIGSIQAETRAVIGSDSDRGEELFRFHPIELADFAALSRWFRYKW